MAGPAARHRIRKIPQVQRTDPVPQRFYSLDVARGIAALSVVFYHWQHFFYSGTRHGTFDWFSFPMGRWAFVLYTQAWLAVDMFFCLSGFIFYWLYSRPVAERRISPARFAVLRFSRLYPLHLATLLFVAAGQLWLLTAQGSYFVYAHNGVKDFVLNLMFIWAWGFSGVLAFNGPAWSVSVEVLLYALFFACCRMLPLRTIVPVLIATLAFLVELGFHSTVGRGILSFFLGGAVYRAYRAIVASSHATAITRGAAYLAVGSWLATLLLALPDAPALPALWGLEKRWPCLVLFPITILSLALLETRRGSLGKRLAWVGDISYSSYMLHFPLQMIVVVVIARLKLGTSIYYSPWFMAFFFGLLVLISLASHRYFELPAQGFLRKALYAHGERGLA